MSPLTWTSPQKEAQTENYVAKTSTYICGCESNLGQQGPQVLVFGSIYQGSILGTWTLKLPIKIGYHPIILGSQTPFYGNFEGPGAYFSPTATCQVLDMFCGSGTVLVESLVAGKRALGCDVSPLALLLATHHTDARDIDLQEFLGG